MPYWRLFYHITWSTKGRMLWIASDWERDLYQVIVAKAEALGAQVYAIGGIEDHIHLVASIPPKIALSKFVGQTKGNSSHFVNHVLCFDFHFAWQREYGIVSFGEKHLQMVISYVRKQREHHSSGKLIAFLERCDVEGLPGE